MIILVLEVLKYSSRTVSNYLFSFLKNKKSILIIYKYFSDIDQTQIKNDHAFIEECIKLDLNGSYVSSTDNYFTDIYQA